jgi:hypothetical protein
MIHRSVPRGGRGISGVDSRVVGQFGDDPAQAEACRALPARKMFMAALMSAWASCPHA